MLYLACFTFLVILLPVSYIYICWLAIIYVFIYFSFIYPLATMYGTNYPAIPPNVILLYFYVAPPLLIYLFIYLLTHLLHIVGHMP